MKRPKLGDVYYVKVPNGYKLFQWAYSIPRKGDYIRVFDGLYENIPEDIADIVAGPHSYILPFNLKRLYRLGMSQLLANYAVPEEYPFPQYMISFWINPKTRKVFGIELMSTVEGVREWKDFEVQSMKELPLEYQNETLLNKRVGPAWLFYLFDTNFNLSQLELFSPGRNEEEALAPYLEIVNEALEKEKERKENKK